MDIKLTISLLASDRRESLERCLDSLRPLLVKIPSELIVVLTGTDEKVREIAARYTSHIVSFKWCGDFSAARNSGLKESQGEWFLYLDDDEWFDDADEICEFFLSGEYLHYHSAHYIQRNYQNWNGTQFSDFSAFRMIERLPGSHFRGTIHEELSPRIEPCKFFQTFVHHYGYADDSAAANKTSRNIPMLLQSIEAQPNLTKNYIQISKEFGLVGDWQSAEKYCRKGIDICLRSDDLRSMGWLNAYLAYLAEKKPGKASAIQELETILEERHPAELTCLILYQQLIHLYAEEQDPAKAVCYGRKFEELLEQMDMQPILWEVQGYGEFCEDFVKSPERLYGARADCAECAFKAGDCKSAVYFLERFPWDTEEFLHPFYPDLERWRQKNPSVFTEFIDGQDNMDLPPYLLLLRALDCLEKGNTEDGTALFMQCMAQADRSCLQQILLKEAIYHHMGLLPLASKMTLDSWNSCTAAVTSAFPYHMSEQLLRCESELTEPYPFHGLCLRKHRLRLKLTKGFPLWDELIETLEAYCQCILDFYGRFCREEMFRESNRDFLPDECRFAQTSLKALELMGRDQMPEAVRLFGDSLSIDPNMTGVITELFRQAANRMDRRGQHMGEEFCRLAGQMKETLYALLETGQSAEATAILDQLLPLMPEDLELIRIRQEFIRRSKS